MSLLLNEIEVRILGSLIEKEISTPDYYPMTLNALTNACNQKNNRDPIVEFEDTTVVRGLDSLRDKSLATMVTGAGMRVPKYRQKITEVLALTEQQTAALCILMLRGPQTVGEIRNRGAMLFEFQNLEETELVLQSLIERTPDTLVAHLPRLAGQKEIRFAHLLCGEPHVVHSSVSLPPEAARVQVLSENERITKLEVTVQSLKEEQEKLIQQFAEFKKQFE
ncbi:MAG: YceH family protein [Ignavibacteriales bacterium]|nr:YceH family protein [Ignavibacteriales bacterium]